MLKVKEERYYYYDEYVRKSACKVHVLFPSSKEEGKTIDDVFLNKNVTFLERTLDGDFRIYYDPETKCYDITSVFYGNFWSDLDKKANEYLEKEMYKMIRVINENKRKMEEYKNEIIVLEYNGKKVMV